MRRIVQKYLIGGWTYTIAQTLDGFIVTRSKPSEPGKAQRIGGGMSPYETEAGARGAILMHLDKSPLKKKARRKHA